MFCNTESPEDHRFFDCILPGDIRNHLRQILIPFHFIEECRIGIRIIQYLLPKCLKTFGTVLDKPLIVKLFINNNIGHHVQYQKICFKRNNTVMFCQACQFRLSHINDSKVVVFFCHINNAVGNDRVCFHRIGTDDHHEFCLVNIVIRIGCGSFAYGCPHPFETGRVTDTCTVVYVRGIHRFPAKLLKSVC